MENKRVKTGRVFLFIILFFLANLGSFVYENRDSLFLSGGITGNSIANTFNSGLGDMDLVSRVFLISQWTLLFLTLLIAAYKNRKVKKLEKETIKVRLNKDKQKNQTDLDTLYDILKQKKGMKLSVIAKTFKINKDIALEWGKILESGGLAEIDYPGFGEPTIRIKQESEETPEKDSKDKSEKNSKDKEKSKEKKKEKPESEEKEDEKKGRFGLIKSKEKPEAKPKEPQNKKGKNQKKRNKR